MNWIAIHKQEPPTNKEIIAKHPVTGDELIGKAYSFGREWRIKHSNGDVPFYQWAPNDVKQLTTAP